MHTIINVVRCSRVGSELASPTEMAKRPESESQFSCMKQAAQRCVQSCEFSMYTT